LSKFSRETELIGQTDRQMIEMTDKSIDVEDKGFIRVITETEKC
jgi:hypothetical protein